MGEKTVLPLSGDIVLWGSVPVATVVSANHNDEEGPRVTLVDGQGRRHYKVPLDTLTPLPSLLKQQLWQISQPLHFLSPETHRLQEVLRELSDI